MKFRHTQFDESVNVTRSRPLKDFVTYLCAVIALIGVVYFGSAYAVNWVIPYIDQETEEELWRLIFHDRYTPGDGEARDERIVMQEQYLQALLDAIPKEGLVNKTHYQVIVVPDSKVNAMALPSGKIVVYSGLIEKMKSENALVFVLGHELGHFGGRDHLRGMGRSLIAGVLLAPFTFSESNGAGMLSLFSDSFSLHFSREQELKADVYGLYALAAIYGHAGGATEFFEYVQKHEKAPWLYKYANTHPISSERIKHLRKMMKKFALREGPTTEKEK